MRSNKIKGNQWNKSSQLPLTQSFFGYLDLCQWLDAKFSFKVYHRDLGSSSNVHQKYLVIEGTFLPV